MLKNLNKLAEANKQFQLSVEDQATILGLAIKVSNQGVPYFRKEVAVAIKTALVDDKVITADKVLFEKLRTTQPDAWYRPVGEWLELEQSSVKDEDETI